MKKTALVFLGLTALNPLNASDLQGSLVLNGDFSQNDCNKNWCIFNTPNSVRNWIPSPEIEVGYGQIYSNSLGKQRVIELAPNANTCIKQIIKNVEPGCYELKFSWGARKGRGFEDCQFNVSLNGKVLKSFFPTDYNVKNESFHVTFDYGCETELQFCGIGGTDNGTGAFIKSVSLIKNPSIPSRPQIPPPRSQIPQNPQLPTPQLPQAPQFPTIQIPQTPQLPNSQFPQAPSTLFPEIPNYDIKSLSPINVNIPVPNAPTYKLPPVVIPNLPNVILPDGPVLTPIGFNPPSLKPPTSNPPPTFNPPSTNTPNFPPSNYDNSGFLIDSHSSKCYAREYNLQTGGDIEIEFNYKILTNLYVRDSAIFVIWDGKQVAKVFPVDSGKTIRFKSNTSKGSHQLKFCALGCPSEKIHQVSIKNVVIYQKQCTGGWGKDLIVNGGFEQNACTTAWCIWTAKNVQADSVPGWIASPDIEVGRGNVYNSKLGTSWVSELDPNSNTCIKQKVPLKSGKALLSFDWAGRSGIAAESCQFDVKLNGQTLQSFRPSNDDVKREEISLEISSCPVESEIEFCGSGTSESYGALVDNIKLTNWDQCLNQKIVKY